MNTDKMNTLKSGVYRGAYFTKEAPADAKTAEALLAPLTTEMSNIVSALEKSKKDSETQYTELNNHFGGVKATTEELKATVLKHAADYAEMITKQQMLTQALDQVKKELDAPIIKGGKDLERATAWPLSNSSAAPSCSRAAPSGTSSRISTTSSTPSTTVRQCAR